MANGAQEVHIIAKQKGMHPVLAFNPIFLFYIQTSPQQY